MGLSDKIKSIISTRQLTPSHFADQIGVQRSSISHILSGRNRPSLDIIQRIVARFPDITYDWLLETEEVNTSIHQNSTHRVASLSVATVHQESNTKFKKSDVPAIQMNTPTDSGILHKDVLEQGTPAVKDRSVEKILIFYSDNTFTEYLPSLT